MTVKISPIQPSYWYASDFAISIEIAGEPHVVARFETYDDLLCVRRRYITKEQLRAAIAKVCNAIFSVRRADLWGKGPPPAPRIASASGPGTRTC